MTDSLEQDMENIPNISVENSSATTLSNDSNKHVSAQGKRLEYLLEQAEIFQHFVTNGTKIKNAGKTNTGVNKRKALSERTNNKRSREEYNASHSATTAAEQLKKYVTNPEFISGEMRDYQLRGLNWLITLYENGINGILGDEMGLGKSFDEFYFEMRNMKQAKLLGKTLQTISLLGYLKHVKKIKGPFLVVAPLSTLQNWLNEINRFCPSLNAFIMHGYKVDRRSLLKKMKMQDGWDVCITSYEMCKMEINSFKSFRWNYVVLDEAHKIKNEDAKVSQAMHSIETDHRLLLTGTPMQNNLHELWALLNFLLPDVFSSAADFDTWFDSNDCLRGNNDTINRIQKILQPFMLRRIKSEVETTLLPKNEVKLFIGMTSLQRVTYKKVLQKDIQVIREGALSYKKINHILMELRKVANHPYLIEGVEPGPPYTTDQHLVDSCGKMIVLDQLLPKLKSQGSRVVFFSQFVIVLNIIEDYLLWKGYKYLRLDGNTSIGKRSNDINQFNEENSDIFIYLISTRAGGLGINLATADTVIVYDSDWNPQVDFQAIDRVHRIGQTKQVNIFRFITENTVDHRIVQRAEIKKRLDEIVIKNSRKDKRGRRGGGATKKDMMDAIKFDADDFFSTKTFGGNFDLKKILKDGERRTAEDKEKIDKMTLEDASSTSVYQFEGADFRDKKRGQ